VNGPTPHTAEESRLQPAVVQSTWYLLPILPRFTTARAPAGSMHVGTDDPAWAAAAALLAAVLGGVLLAPAHAAAPAGRRPDKGALTEKLPDALPCANVLRRQLRPALYDDSPGKTVTTANPPSSPTTPLK